MNNYMVEVELPRDLTEEFLALIPRQRAHVDALMKDGIITSYALSKDRSRLWITMDAKTDDEVQNVMRSFPMVKFFDFEVRELMFLNRTGFILPQMSLN
jgi:hypothetical protein